MSQYEQESVPCSLIFPIPCTSLVLRYRSLPRTVSFLWWLFGQADLLPIHGSQFPASPPSISITAKYLGSVGTQTQEKRCSEFPGSLSVGCELDEQYRGREDKGTSRALFQASFSLCIGLAEGLQLRVCSWPSIVTDLLPTKEWTMPLPWKSPVFSWLGLEGYAIQSG